MLIGSEGPGSSSVGFPATKSTKGSTAWNATIASRSGRYRRWRAIVQAPAAMTTGNAYIAYRDQSQPIRTR